MVEQFRQKKPLQTRRDRRRGFEELDERAEYGLKGRRYESPSRPRKDTRRGMPQSLGDETRRIPKELLSNADASENIHRDPTGTYLVDGMGNPIRGTGRLAQGQVFDYSGDKSRRPQDRPLSERLENIYLDRSTKHTSYSTDALRQQMKRG